MVARHYGINVLDITLLPIGGVARMPTTPEDPRQEVLISAAGPAASLVLAISLWFVSDLLGYGPQFLGRLDTGESACATGSGEFHPRNFQFDTSFSYGWRTRAPRTFGSVT